MKINLKKTKIMVFQKRAKKNAELRWGRVSRPAEG